MKKFFPMNVFLFCVLAFSAAGSFAQPLTLVKSKRIYEHHSSTINGNANFGESFNGSQSAYDFVNHAYENSTTAPDYPNTDLVEHNGPFGSGSISMSFTSGVSSIWNGEIRGNQSTKYNLAPSWFNFDEADSVLDLALAYDAPTSNVAVNALQKGQVYIARIRNFNMYAAIRITEVKSLTSQQIADMNANRPVKADLYFDFEYKYGTLANGLENTVTILAQPAGLTVCESDTARFGINARAVNGAQLNYQWRKGTAPITNTSRISGATSAVLSIANPRAANEGEYNVIVTRAGSPVSIQSAGAVLAVIPTVSITQQPANVRVCEGDSIAALTVVSGTDAVSYQWQKDGADLAGANESSYLPTTSGSYRVIIRNECSQITSRDVTVSISTKTMIGAQPQDQSIAPGGVIVLSVQAQGTTLRYQWMKNGSDITGATNSQYVKSGADASDAGSYSVRVSGECGELVSETATVTVSVPSAIGEQSEMNGYTLNLAGPNPFAGQTQISYFLPADAPVLIRLRDIYGREMAVLPGSHEAGSHSIIVNAGELGLSAGTYFLSLTAPGAQLTRKLVVIQ